MSTQQQLDHLRSLLPASEVLERDAPGYKEQSAPWSVWADQRPPLVLQPTTLESMSKVVKYLYESDLDFAVRNTGTGSVSAKDVIVSTHGFKDFKFDKAAETVTLGSGYCWGEVDALMEKEAHGYQVVGARCSWVGVTGSALVGGLSWLSHEYGMISDPQNLLDMQVVLADGKVLWASEEPELMWALRGGGGNFGGKSNLMFCVLHQYLIHSHSSRNGVEAQSPQISH
jgi:FAD/FMN-containing dehydrogenase